MVIREVQDRDFIQLAEMRWTHAVENDETYGEHNTDGITKSVFVERFLELSLFYGLSSPLNSEMICIFPYF
ncbi:MAG: hypothetical protein ACLR6N_07095 [Ruminococcus sp.]